MALNNTTPDDPIPLSREVDINSADGSRLPFSGDHSHRDQSKDRKDTPYSGRPRLDRWREYLRQQGYLLPKGKPKETLKKCYSCRKVLPYKSAWACSMPRCGKAFCADCSRPGDPNTPPKCPRCRSVMSELVVSAHNEAGIWTESEKAQDIVEKIHGLNTQISDAKNGAWMTWRYFYALHIPEVPWSWLAGSLYTSFDTHMDVLYRLHIAELALEMWKQTQWMQRRDALKPLR